MNKDQFQQLIQAGPVLLDGATGTHLQAAGMPSGVCPEAWVLDHPDILTSLQRAYFDAGSQIVMTCTFGANRPKMEHYPISLNAEELNRRVAAISIGLRDELRQKSPGRTFFVAGELGPTGQFLLPSGDVAFDEMVDIYREQARGLVAAGVDLFAIETMIDLAEVRAAVLAIQAECDLPIIASLTYDAKGRTLSGNTPLECLLTLASLGVSASGINCSFGPDLLGTFIEPLRPITPIPLMLKPNAGLPTIIEGRTVFPLDAKAFAQIMRPLAGHGVLLLGGCCGTSPAHIAELRTALSVGEISSTALPAALPAMICSARKSWLIENPRALPVVSCTDADSLSDDVYDVMDDEPAAIILDLDAAAVVSGVKPIVDAFIQLQVSVPVPLVFRSDNHELLQKLLRIYCGRAGVIGALPVLSFGALVV